MSKAEKDLEKPKEVSLRLTCCCCDDDDACECENPSAAQQLADGAAFFLKAVGLGLFLLLVSRACSGH